jgi:hypothetical protein
MMAVIRADVENEGLAVVGLDIPDDRRPRGIVGHRPAPGQVVAVLGRLVIELEGRRPVIEKPADAVEVIIFADAVPAKS